VIIPEHAGPPRQGNSAGDQARVRVLVKRHREPWDGAGLVDQDPRIHVGNNVCRTAAVDIRRPNNAAQ
jgi:hypothetical protein